MLPIKNKIMWHVVCHIDEANKAVGVEITTNPYEHKWKAAIIMHKSSSRQCAMQVGRFVRRTLLIEKVSVHRASTPFEAMLGYAVSRTLQYAPNAKTPCFDLVKKIAATSIANLLSEVVGGHSAARTRYTVVEARSDGVPVGRFVTNKLHAVERMWRDAPADKVIDGSIHVIGSFQERAQAEACVNEVGAVVNAALWTRKPPVEWLRSVIEERGEDIVYRSTETSALRMYQSRTEGGVPKYCVLIGSQIYTIAQVRKALLGGEWIDGRIHATDAKWFGINVEGFIKPWYKD